MAASYRSEDEQGRAWCRRSLVSEVTYGAMPRSGTDEHYDADTHITSLTFMSGYHFPPGATTWADLKKPARLVLSPVLNGFKHLAPNGKKLTAKQLAMAAAASDPAALHLASVPLAWQTEVAIEAIPSEASEKDAPVFCAGYRVHFIGHEHGGGAPQMDVDENAGGGGGDPAAATGATARGGGNGRGNEMAKARRALLKDARNAPLATALAKSFAEAAALRETVLRKREEYIKGHTAKRGELVARLEARVNIKEGRQVPEYAWEEVADMVEYLREGIKPYFAVPAECRRAHPLHDPGVDCLQYEQACSELEAANDDIRSRTAHKMLSDADYYVHTASPLHPDYLFCMARSMAYFMRDGDYSASKECTVLSNYLPGAHGIPRPNAPVGAASQDVQTDSVMSDEGEEEEEDDGINLRRFFRNSGAPYDPLVARGTWPFPGLVHKLNSLATYAEVFFTVLPLPYAIGAEIPAAALHPQAPSGTILLPPTELSDLHVERTLSLRATENLRRAEETSLLAVTEEAAAAAGNEENGLPFTFAINRRPLPSQVRGLVTVRGKDGQVRQQVVSDVVVQDAPDPTQNAGRLLDQQEEAERLAAARRQELAPDEEIEKLEVEEGANGIPDKYKKALERQKSTVRAAIADLATRFRRMHYDEIYRTAWEQRLEQSSTDAHMPAREFYPPHSGDDDDGDDAGVGRDLNRLRKQLASQRDKTGFTLADERIVFDSIDMQPAWLKEREEPLEIRPMFQMEKATQSHKQAKERDALLRDPKYANDKDGLKRALWKQEEEHAAQIDKLKRSMYLRGHAVYMETERLAPALKVMRDYAKHQVMPDRDKPHDIRPQSVSVRGFSNFRQFYTDTYRTSELATKANYPFTERVHTCAYHAFRWMPGRTDPALNLVMSGKSGAGKSKALLTTVSLFPTGVVSDVASETTNSYNVDQNFDGYIVLYQEMPNDLLFSNQGGGKGKDQGPSDKTNFAKARMTSFHTHTRYFTANEQTGKREAKICDSSQHIVTMGATNQDLTKMDTNMRRRLMIDVFAEASTESEGSNPADMERLQSLSAHAFRVQDKAGAQHRELAAGYAYMENAIKMGIVDDVLYDGGRVFLNHILERASDVIGSAARNKGNRTWVIEAARILTLQHAVYETLFGVRAKPLYETGKYKRWSPQAFQYICEPQLGVMKDAVIYALTMLDFLYSSQTEDMLLRTIAKELLHVDEPRRWRFRLKGDLTDDPNYLSFVGKNMKQIYEAIVARHASVNIMRSEDIPVILGKHMTKKHSSLGYEAVERDASGQPLRLVAAQLGGGATLEERAAFLYEDDPQSKSEANKPKQFCMSVEFIKKLFGVDLATDTPEQVRAKIELREPRIDAEKLRAKEPLEAIEELQRLMECMPSRAPLVAAIKKALRMPNLERSPYEAKGVYEVDQELYKYPCAYLPPDMYIDFGHWEKRVPVDGATMFIRGERDPDGDCIMQVNYTMPLPTALSNLYAIHPGESVRDNVRTRDLPELSLGFYYDEYDVDYYTALSVMRRQGYPVEPLFLELFTKALVHFRDKRRHPNADAYRDLLLEHIPELDPAARVPLPFAFPPIAYMIDRYLVLVEYGWKEQEHFPVGNPLARLQQTLNTTDAKANKNDNGALARQSEYHHCAERREFARYNIKRQREVGQEEEERPAKRARVDPVNSDDDAMDIDGDILPAAAGLQRHMPQRPASPPSVFEEEEEDDMFTE
jgi:hypothetical protein